MCDIIPGCKKGQCETGFASYFVESSQENYRRAKDLFRFLRRTGWKNRDLVKVLTRSRQMLLDHWLFFEEEDKPKIMIPKKAVETPATLMEYFRKRFPGEEL